MDTSTLDVPNSRAIAAQLLVLSQDPENQQYIVQEQGCMAGLVGYLDHPEHEVVLMATRALQFLSSNATNKRPMAVFPGLVSELLKLFDREGIPKRAREFTGKTLDNLGLSLHRDETNDKDDGENCENGLSSKGNVSVAAVNNENAAGSANAQQPASEQPDGAAKDKGNKTKNGSGNSLHTTVLQVEKLHDDEVADAVRKNLLSVSGVISVVIDEKRGRVTAGSRIASSQAFIALLKQAVADAGSVAMSWPPPMPMSENSNNNNKKKVSSSGVLGGVDMNVMAVEEEDEGSMPAEGNGEGMIDLPEYLDEDEYDEEGNDLSVMRFGCNSLSARLARQEEEEEEKRKQERLINKVSNAFNNAGSWLMGW